MHYSLSFEANPVLIYELRQIVRNRVILAIFSLYLAILAVFVGASILPNAKILEEIGNFFWYIGTPNQQNLGAFVASGTLLIYYVFTAVVLMGFAALRTTTDRLNENPMFYSPLPAWRIVIGKLLFGIVVNLLFLSATLPFLCAAYLLRGVDILMLCWSVLIFGCLILLQYFITVMFYAGAIGMLRVIFLSLPMLFLQFLLSLFGLFVALSCASEISRGVDWGLAIILSLMFVVFMLVSGVLALVQFSPPTSNRMLPLRILLTSLHLAAIVGVLLIALIKGWGNIHDMACAINLVFCFTFPYLFLIFVCERVEYSARIRRTIPEDFQLRLLVFPFYTGAANAIAWCLLAFILELIGLGFITSNTSLRSSMFWITLNGLSSGLLFFDYCVTALLLYNLVFYRSFPREMIWFPIFCFFAMMLVAFYLAIFMVRRVWDFAEMLFFLPNPLCVDDNNFISMQLTLAVVWLIALMLPGLPWIVRHFAKFTPYDPTKEDRRMEELSN